MSISLRVVNLLGRENHFRVVRPFFVKAAPKQGRKR
jgi:hypothetical protein